MRCADHFPRFIGFSLCFGQVTILARIIVLFVMVILFILYAYYVSSGFKIYWMHAFAFLYHSTISLSSRHDRNNYGGDAMRYPQV